jgi:hypothetical protein
MNRIASELSPISWWVGRAVLCAPGVDKQWTKECPTRIAAGKRLARPTVSQVHRPNASKEIKEASYEIESCRFYSTGRDRGHACYSL